jgi:hypothetical protein
VAAHHVDVTGAHVEEAAHHVDVTGPHVEVLTPSLGHWHAFATHVWPALEQSSHAAPPAPHAVS